MSLKQLVESQGPIKLHGHGLWLVCEVVVTYTIWFLALLESPISLYIYVFESKVTHIHID